MRAESGGLSIGESDLQDDVRFTANRDAEPIKRSPNLKAVYLEEFKRSLAWAILSTTDTEYWQWLPKKPFRKSRKTA